MSQSGSKTWQAPQPTFWERTKAYSGSTWSSTLKPNFDKAYKVVDKLAPPVNRLTNKVGSETFWPTTLDKESEKCARILRTFCKDGFYDKIVEAEAAKKAEDDRRDPRENNPNGVQRNVVKIPAKIIQNAVGLAIFTSMRTGWVIGGNGGSGVLIARIPETGEWSPPTGFMTQNMSVGFLFGADIFDTVLVINNYQALEAFTRLRCTLGPEVGVAAGPVGVGGDSQMELHKKTAPVWSYVKSRGLYAGIALAGNVVIERSDENARFYGYQLSAAEILAGKVRHPPERDYKILLDTARAAEGQDVDEELLPDGDAPGDLDVDFQAGTFGIPSAEDDDPYGVKALEAEGLAIREAGTHQRPSLETFEFNPAPTSPIYKTYRQSIDGASLKRKTDSWRNSTTSVNSIVHSPISTNSPKGKPPALPPRTSLPSTFNTNNPDIENDSSPERAQTGPSKNVSPDRALTATPEQDDLQSARKSSEGKSERTSTPMGHATLDQNVGNDNVAHDKGLERKDTKDTESDLSDFDSDAEIATAVTSIARPKVVQVLRPVPPPLPSRNPGRALVSPMPRSQNFTVKFKSNQTFPEDKLVLRTSVDNWTLDRRGNLKDGVWHFDLDATQFEEDFQCKFVVLPGRWMHDPNLTVTSPAPGEDITFTDSRVIFDSPSDQELQDETSIAHSVKSDDDAFVSVPPTPDGYEDKEFRTDH